MYEYNAKVDRVVDGDTVDFIVDLGFNINIKIRTRFNGVNTPEKGHIDWEKATSKCIELLQEVGSPSYMPVRDTVVKIKTEKTGKYGRWLVDIPGVTDVLKEIWPYEEKR